MTRKRGVVYSIIGATLSALGHSALRRVSLRDVDVDPIDAVAANVALDAHRQVGVDDSVDVEAAAARIARRRLGAARDAREDARDAREDERDGRRVVDAREGGDRARRRATARMNGIIARRRVRDSSEIVAMSPSRVVVSTKPLARRRTRSLSTSRRVRTSRATIDDDDAVADAFRKMYSPEADKSIHFGVFTRDVDPAAIPSDEERARRRSVAARELTVIDDEERGRRDDGGDGGERGDGGGGGGAASRSARLDSSESRSRFRCFSRSDSSDPRRPGRETSRRGDVGRRRFGSERNRRTPR